MKNLYLLIFLLLINLSNAQIGIGNTNPKAQLDISASSPSAPIATDGLLIPRVTAFPAPVTIDQNGMMVFLTTAFAGNKVGFYYYDFPSLTWKWMATGNNGNIWQYNNANTRIDLPFQSDGTTARPIGNEAVILDNGNVGFGTLNPARHFQVNRDFNAGTKFAVSNPNSGINAFSQITAETIGSTSYLYSLNNGYVLDPLYPWFTASNSLLQGTGVGGLSLGATNPLGFMNFFTGGLDESMRISASGNVGIGTKTPAANLDVFNGAIIRPSGSTNPNSYFKTNLFNTSDGRFNLGVTLDGTNFFNGLHFYNGVLGFGNDGIGVDNTALRIYQGRTFIDKLDVNPNLATDGPNNFKSLRLSNTAVSTVLISPLAGNYRDDLTFGAKELFFETGGSASIPSSATKMIIKDNGNVGINTVSPSEKLDLVGNFKFSGALMPNNLAGTSGQILASVGAGASPTWTSASSITANEWHTTGNALTVNGTNFIGTTDNVPLNFRVDNQKAARISSSGDTFFGYRSGDINTAVNNTGFGAGTLSKNTTGEYNQASGNNALSKNISGNSNTANGYSALFENTIGINNTATGRNSLNDNTANNNTANGHTSLYKNTSGASNVGIGYQALYQNLVGANNTAIGTNALENNLGSRNIGIGFNAAVPDNAANNQMSIGNVIYGTTMSTTALGKIGIGEPAPTEKLDVAGNLKVSGAIMPNNLPGTSGQVLVSAGAGTAPIWESNPTKPYATTGALTGVYNVSLSEYTIRVFNDIAEIRLPNAAGNLGKTFVIIGSNGIATKTWSTAGGTIYDDVTSTTYTTLASNQRFVVQSDGAGWIVIGR